MMPLFPKEPKPQPSGRAPLFERLSGAPKWFDEDGVRRSIGRELRRILNSRAMVESARRSSGRGMRVMGWSEIMTRNPIADAYIIEREVKKRIAILEPRLEKVSVELIQRGKRFVVHITGNFRLKNQHPPIRFQSAIPYNVDAA